MIQYNVIAHEALNRDNLSKKCFHTRLSILKNPSYNPKIIGDILKNIQKASASVLMRLYD